MSISSLIPKLRRQKPSREPNEGTWMLKSLAIANYRSIRELVLPLGPLNLVTGPNGSGKSNLYRALRLLVDTVQGAIVASLAREGGLDSTLWAGPESISRRIRSREVPIEGVRRKEAVSLRLGIASEDFGYAIDLGLPIPSDSMFFYDHFRTDADAPPRQPQVGTRTTVLGHDGRDLAAALQTIREIGDGEALNRAVADAFPGAELEISE